MPVGVCEGGREWAKAVSVVEGRESYSEKGLRRTLSCPSLAPLLPPGTKAFPHIQSWRTRKWSKSLSSVSSSSIGINNESISSPSDIFHSFNDSVSMLSPSHGETDNVFHSPLPSQAKFPPLPPITEGQVDIVIEEDEETYEEIFDDHEGEGEGGDRFEQENWTNKKWKRKPLITETTSLDGHPAVITQQPRPLSLAANMAMGHSIPSIPPMAGMAAGSQMGCSLENLRSDAMTAALMRTIRGRSTEDRARCQSYFEPMAVSRTSEKNAEESLLDRSISHSTPSIDSAGHEEGGVERLLENKHVTEKKVKKTASSVSGPPTWQRHMTASLGGRPVPALVGSASSKSLRPPSKLHADHEKKVKRSGSSILSSAFNSFRKPHKVKQGKPHLWVQASVSNSARCDACGKELARGQSPAHQCEKCDVFVHDHCKGSIPSCSKWTNKHPHDQSPRNKHLLAPDGFTSSPDSNTPHCHTVEGSGGWVNGYGDRLASSSTFPLLNGPLEEESEGYLETEEDMDVRPTPSLRPTASFPPLADSLWDEDLGDLWAAEPEAWSVSYKSLCKRLKSREVKRQDVIYELYKTEKHHCQTLFILKRTYQETLAKRNLLKKKELSVLIPDVLDDLLDFHLDFLRKLLERRNETAIVSTVQDILLEQFNMNHAEKAVEAYTKFCSGKNEANEMYHELYDRNNQFKELMDTIYGNIKYKERSLSDCLLLITQRLTKYPVFVESIQKNTDGLTTEENALQVVKEFTAKVDQGVQKEELRSQWAEISSALDPTVASTLNEHRFTVADLIRSNREPLYIGKVNCHKAVGKTPDVTMVLFGDILVFLQKNSSGSRYSFYSADRKNAVIFLGNLLIRERATKPLGLYLIVTNRKQPELYDICSVRKGRQYHNELFQVLSTASKNCPTKAPVRVSGRSDSEEREREELNVISNEIASQFRDREEIEKKMAEYFQLKVEWYDEFKAKMEPLLKDKGKKVLDRVRRICVDEFQKSAAKRNAMLLKYVDHTEILWKNSIDEGLNSLATSSTAEDGDGEVKRSVTFHGHKDLVTKHKPQPRRHTTVPKMDPNSAVIHEEIEVEVSDEEKHEVVPDILGWDSASRDAIVAIITSMNELRSENEILASRLTETSANLDAWKQASDVQRQVTLEQLRQNQTQLHAQQRKFQEEKETHGKELADRERKVKEKEDLLQNQMQNLAKLTARVNVTRPEEKSAFVFDDYQTPSPPTPLTPQQHYDLQYNALLSQQGGQGSPLSQEHGQSPQQISHLQSERNSSARYSLPLERINHPPSQHWAPGVTSPGAHVSSMFVPRPTPMHARGGSGGAIMSESLQEKLRKKAVIEVDDRRISSSYGMQTPVEGQRREKLLSSSLSTPTLKKEAGETLGLPIKLASEPKKTTQKKKKK